MRQGHWAVVDLIGKGGHIRTVAIPEWVKAALDEWTVAARVTGGRIFRAVARTGKVWGKGISQNVVWYMVKTCCERAGLQHIAPHDLRRTCAKLCHSNGGELEQIQFLLGHASVQTTERYLGCKQNLGHPVNDLFHLEVMAAACSITGPAVIEKPDRIVYEHAVGSHQEGADTRTSARNAGYGNSSV
jgi:site-specific recombinase XerD